MSEKVTYHQEGGRDREYVVLSRNTDGTVDIGPEGGPAVVTSAEVVDSPAIGKVTLSAVETEDPNLEEGASGKNKPKK